MKDGDGNTQIAILMVYSYNSQVPNGLTCNLWGQNQNPDIPIIIDDTQYNDMIRDWFGFGEWDISPKHIIIDKDFKYVDMVTTEGDAEIIIEDLLD